MSSTSILEIQSLVKEETNHDRDDANIDKPQMEKSMNSGYKTPDQSPERSMQFSEVSLKRYILFTMNRYCSFFSTTPLFI